MYTSITGSFGSGTELWSTTVFGSGASARGFAVTAVWLSHSSLRDWLTVKATSSAVRGWPSDHFMFGRSLYVQVLPSSDPFHDVARPRTGAKSFAALPTSCSYWRFHAS